MKTPQQILAEQKADAEWRKATAAAIVAQEPSQQLPAVPNGRTFVEQYIDAIAPTTFPGRLIKFDGKAGAFTFTDNGERVAEDRDFVALVDETLVGWIKFNGEGAPPERHQGLLFDGWTMPSRESLGDTDPSKWELGLDGQPADPWLHHMAVVLEDRGAGNDLCTFATTSKTGRKACGNLLRTFERMRRREPGHYPVIQLKPGGYQSDKRGVGWVHVPNFVVVGRAPIAGTAKPDTSISADINDELSF